MDNSKNLTGWQPPGAPGAAPQLGFENMAHESQPMNPPPYQGPMNPPPYQSQYPGQPGYPQSQPGYPQSQPGYQNPYPQQQPGYANSYPPQPQNGFQNPYPNQPQNGFENPYPAQPGAYQNPYPDNQQQAGYQSDYPADQFIHDESERRSNGKESKKHKKFFYIIGAVVVMIAVICIGIAVSKGGSDSSSDKKPEPEKRQKTTEKPKSKPDKFVTENCTLIMNLYKFLNCSDLKNCQPTILMNMTKPGNETVKSGNETAKAVTNGTISVPDKPANKTAGPKKDLFDGETIVLDPFADDMIVIDPSKTKLLANEKIDSATDQLKNETIDATASDQLNNEMTDVTATDESKNVTIDVTQFLNCSMVIFCNGTLSCGDNLNITILSTGSTSSSDVSRTIVYRRPYSSMIPMIIPIPIPLGGGMFGGNKYHNKNKYSPSYPVGNPLKPKIFSSKGGRKG